MTEPNYDLLEQINSLYQKYNFMEIIKMYLGINPNVNIIFFPILPENTSTSYLNIFQSKFKMPSYDVITINKNFGLIQFKSLENADLFLDKCHKAKIEINNALIEFEKTNIPFIFNTLLNHDPNLLIFFLKFIPKLLRDSTLNYIEESLNILRNIISTDFFKNIPFFLKDNNQLFRFFHLKRSIFPDLYHHFYEALLTLIEISYLLEIPFFTPDMFNNLIYHFAYNDSYVNYCIEIIYLVLTNEIVDIHNFSENFYLPIKHCLFTVQLTKLNPDNRIYYLYWHLLKHPELGFELRFVSLHDLLSNGQGNQEYHFYELVRLYALYLNQEILEGLSLEIEIDHLIFFFNEISDNDSSGSKISCFQLKIYILKIFHELLFFLGESPLTAIIGDNILRNPLYNLKYELNYQLSEFETNLLFYTYLKLAPRVPEEVFLQVFTPWFFREFLGIWKDSITEDYVELQITCQTWILTFKQNFFDVVDDIEAILYENQFSLVKDRMESYIKFRWDLE